MYFAEKKNAKMQKKKQESDRKKIKKKKRKGEKRSLCFLRIKFVWFCFVDEMQG